MNIKTLYFDLKGAIKHCVFAGMLFLPFLVQADCGMTFTTGDGSITVSGLDATHYKLKLFNPNWSVNFECTDNCSDPQTLSGLAPGVYHLSLQTFDAGWSTSCSFLEDVTITIGGGGCTDNDNDGFCAAEDCNDNDATLPANPGSSCNDGDANTTNDVIQSDGCTCAGTPTNNDCNVTWITTNTSITVSGLNAPHVIFKLFNPNWSTNYSCVDNCGNPITLNGLTPGATYHLSYNLYDADWQGICEDLVDVVIEGSGNNQSDLVLADLQTPGEGDPGTVVDMSLDLKNIGNAVATGDYVIGFYLSIDNSLSNDDVEVGIVNTGNTPIGTINDVAASITIPSGFAADEYYLIAKADINNAIIESNENNNIISQLFNVKDGPVVDDECGFLKTYPIPAGEILTDATVVETGSSFVIANTRSFFSNGNNQKRELTLTIDKNGNQTSITDEINDNPLAYFPLTVSFTDDFDIVAKKENSPGDVAWETTISYQSDLPAGFTIIGTVAFSIVEVADGHLVFGTFAASNGTTDFFQNSTKLDSNGEIVQKNFYETPVIDDFFNFGDPVQSSSTGYLFDLFEQNRLSFLKFDIDGTFQWKTSYATDLPSNSRAGVHLSNDGKYIYAANRNNLKAVLDKVDTDTGEKIYKINLGDVFSASGDFTFEFIEDFIPTADGGIVTGYTYRFPGSNERGYEYGKIDANGDLVWEYDFPPGSNDYDLIPEIQTADGGYVFVQPNADDNTAVRVMKITSTGMLEPTCGGNDPGTGEPLDCDLSYTLENGTFTLSGAGLDAPHVNIKLFSPSWSTVFSCVDDCGSSLTIPIVENGTYHLSVDLFDANWQRTCDFLVDIPNGIQPRLGNQVIIDQYRNIVFENLYPVPASDYITIEISALEEVEVPVHIYDARGALVDKKTLQLGTGNNAVEWNINALPSGFYQVLFESNHAHTPIRFIKQRL